jgi:hypothetical protein
MILEVDDQGRLEVIAVTSAESDREVDGRRFIGGYRFNSSGFESIWFDKAVWDVTLMPKENGISKYRLDRKAS